ncbi:MAG TPA: hypothetical protein PKE30_14185 [Niabella sp.]|nr:hypothetical protein [Niabella sp.]
MNSFKFLKKASFAGFPTCAFVLLELLLAGCLHFLDFALKETSNRSALAWRPAQVEVMRDKLTISHNNINAY